MSKTPVNEQSRNSSEILHHYEYEYAILACIERVMFVSWPDLSLVNTLAQQSVLPVDEDIIHNYIDSNPSMVIVQSEAEEKVIARVDLEWLSDTARKALENNLDWN